MSHCSPARKLPSSTAATASEAATASITSAASAIATHVRRSRNALRPLLGAILIGALIARALGAFHAFCPIVFEVPIRTAVELPRRAGAIRSRAIASGVRVLSVSILGVLIQKTIATGVALTGAFGPLDIIPSAVFKFAPVTVRITTIGVTIPAGINIVAAINDRAAAAAAGDASRITRAVGEAFGAGPIVAAGHLGRSPAAVDA